MGKLSCGRIPTLRLTAQHNLMPNVRYEKNGNVFEWDQKKATINAEKERNPCTFEEAADGIATDHPVADLHSSSQDVKTKEFKFILFTESKLLKVVYTQRSRRYGGTDEIRIRIISANDVSRSPEKEATWELGSKRKRQEP